MIEVLILSTPGCGTCATVKRMLQNISKDIPIEVKEYDVLEHPELLQKYPFMSAPGIVINGKLEFTGVPNEKDLRRKLAEVK
ncbi:MAG: thioredoxin family protein [Candidatus Micrarchaeota archaeon]